MQKPSPADIAPPVMGALLGHPTGSTLGRSAISQNDFNLYLESDNANQTHNPTNALRESNREDTQILYRQAGINLWLNAPFALNVALLAILSGIATGLVYLVR